MSDVLDAPKTEKYTGEPGDEKLFSHYAKKEDIERAILEGEPCTALCGKTWIPTRDPSKFPVCPECKDILNAAFGPE